MNRIRASESERDNRSCESLDSALPTLDRALDAAVAASAIRELLPDSERSGLGSLSEIQLLRHRRGRRCVLRYLFDGTGHRYTPGPSCFVGKIRAKGVNRRSDGIARALRARGFSKSGSFQFTVAEPIGLVHELDMTVQRFYAGACMTELVSMGTVVKNRFEAVGSALAELHAEGVVTDRGHTVGDELAILERRLPRVALRVPELSERIHRLLEDARPVAESLVSRPVRPIHRDFYPDQIIDAFGNLVLLDLDLYTMGDPALDVGNFVAHLREQGLRQSVDENAFPIVEDAFISGYLAASSDTSREDIEKWTQLSLLRHIEITWRIATRRPGLSRIVACCERNMRVLGSA